MKNFSTLKIGKLNAKSCTDKRISPIGKSRRKFKTLVELLQPFRILSIVFVSTALLSIIVLSGCKKTEETIPTPVPVINYCTDGIQNNGETGIDCGGTCVPCADAFNYNLPYYIQFKENGGSFIYFQDDDPQHSFSYNGSLTIAKTYFGPVFNSTHGFVLKYSGTPSSLVGKNLSFDYDVIPSAKMIFLDGSGDEYRTSDNVSDQSGSNCYIESVTLISSEPFGSFTRYKYAVRGNFNCKVADDNGSAMGNIANGKFSVLVIISQ